MPLRHLALLLPLLILWFGGIFTPGLASPARIKDLVEIDGVRGNDLQKNWRIGGTLALPVDIHNSIKLYASSGVSARTDNSFDLVGIAWQHRWGGGL